MTKFYVDEQGSYIGGFDGAEPPAGSIEVPVAPESGLQIWDGEKWLPLAPVVPDQVSARQLKLQLLAAGLLDAVEAWVAAQEKAVQIAFEYSGSFVRAEPMMQAGFAALGFTKEQGDAFFTAAALL